MAANPGAVPWLVFDEEGRAVEPVRRYLIDFVARYNRPGSVRSYAFDLLRRRWWLRVVDVPSKSNEKRLLLVSPELASVLATIVKRLRDANGGKIPLVARYDSHERVTGPLLPHLFQRRPIGSRKS
ncbi:hypothetical protein [Streptosporangium roseum]|uniref:hypothetical protein n=1 Tax=Streptosporangium roseum TaxID=2001 RepID=UPI0004CD55F6|nr:hypothetical protein [Streptosporangium roseum]